MEETTEKPVVSTKENPIPTGRGGWREGGRPKIAESKKATNKTVCLYPDEWAALEAHAARVGARSVGVFAAQILRQYIHSQAVKLSNFNS